uniref:Uncharacterized protein n=1 Tax=Anguilla anguilla TaxID=7936 RepID=A0A0E9RKQ8_ANGAN
MFGHFQWRRFGSFHQHRWLHEDLELQEWGQKEGADWPHLRCELLQVLPLGNGGAERGDGCAGEGVVL